MKSKSEISVIVATHLPRYRPSLEKPFIEVFRGNTLGIFRHPFLGRRSYKFFAGAHLPSGLPLETWSEFGALLSLYPWANQKTVGLSHYRCFLDLENQEQKSQLDFQDLPQFLNRQAEYLCQDASESIYVGTPLIFKSSAWQQFVDCGHVTRNLEALLALASTRLDTHLGKHVGYTEQKLKSSNELIARNLFIGPVKFARAWAEVVMDLSRFLAPLKPSDADPRWAAFIIERLFSVYVLSFASLEGIDVQFKKVIYFN